MVGAHCSIEIEFSIFITQIIVKVSGTVRVILILEGGNAKIVDFGPRTPWVFIIVQKTEMKYVYEFQLSEYSKWFSRTLKKSVKNMILDIGKSHNQFVW